MPEMSRTGPLGRIALSCSRHRWVTLLGWAASAIIVIAMGARFAAHADNNFTRPSAGARLISRYFPQRSGDTLTLAIRSVGPVRSPAVRDRVTAALAPFARAPHVTSVGSPYSSPGQISGDGHIAFATIQFAVAEPGIPVSEVTALMGDARAASGHGLTFSLGGDAVDQAETPQGGFSEGIGAAAAAVVLLVAFGSVLAMGLPILTALLGIGTGLSLIALIGHLVPAPSFAPVVASLIGLGVGVDYALFIVTRFRESMASGAGPEQAVVTALSTAGRAVLFAGTTVIIATLGLFALRQPLLDGVAVAASVTVACVLAGSLTLLPALLGLTGTRLARPSRFSRRRGAAGHRAHPASPLAERWARAVQRKPVVAAAASAAVLVTLAIPVLSLTMNMPDESTQARNTMGYASYQTMADGFGPGFGAPLVIVASLPSRGTPTAPLAAAVRRTPGVARVTPVTLSKHGAAAMMVAYPTTGQQDQATNDLVNRLAGTVLPRAGAGTGIRAYVGGPNAGIVDFTHQASAGLPWMIAIVAGLSALLLVMVFRSVTIAVKAALMNLLSAGAACGVLVAVVQWGWLRGLFGFPAAMPVASWVPVFLFVILFGLSMDYEMFLLSRIREHYVQTGDTSAAVARGLAGTARVISAAAAIMVVVFLSVVLGSDVTVKQFGLGLAVAVLIDATLVRLVLVPAAMELLGRANWWLPAVPRRHPARAPRTLGLIVRNLLFTVVVPGLGGAWYPWWILSHHGHAAVPVAWEAVPVIAAGTALYIWCVWNFAAVGRGTPGLWDAPRRVVASGPYRWVRNPIYVAALLIVLGEAWLFWSLPLLEYAGAMAVFFHLFVIGYEEPALRRRFGATYLDYRRTVPRWLPRLPRQA